MDLELTRSNDDAGRAIVSLVGSIDLQTRDVVLFAGTNALNDRPGLVIDLSGVTFVDSTGLGSLVELRNLARENEKPLVLRDPSERVERVLRLTGLDTAFTIAHTAKD